MISNFISDFMVIGADFSILWQLLSNFSAFEQALCSQASNFYPVFSVTFPTNGPFLLAFNLHFPEKV